MFRTLQTVIQRWQRDEAALLAAAVSYYIARIALPVDADLDVGFRSVLQVDSQRQ